MQLSTPSSPKITTVSFPRQWAMLAAGVVFLLLAGAGLWRWQNAAFPIILEIDGEQTILYTHATSPQKLLHDLGYERHRADAITIKGKWGPNAHLSLQRARPVQILADAHERQVWTRATTVAGVMEDAGISISPADQIILDGEVVSLAQSLPRPRWQPPSGRRTAKPWDQVPIPLTLHILRAKPVQIMEEGGVVHTIWTRAQTVAQALADNDIPIYAGDETIPQLNAAIQPGMRVLLRRATPITIIADGQIIHTRTRAQSVGEALQMLGLLVMGEDEVHPSLSTELNAHDVISITRITTKLEYEDELLPFETVWEADDDLAIDSRRVGNEGHPGILRRRYRVYYKDGQEVHRELEDEWMAQEPVRKIILYGRKITPHTAMTPDGPITYWRKIRAYTTSYSPARSGTDPSLPWYGHTRLGFKAGKGVVGVDPSVINMSQKLYVPGYGFAIAGDTGSGLAGRHVDLGFSDDDYESWHWWSDVYLLWPPPPAYAINWVLPDWPRYKGSRNPYTGLVQEEP